MPANSHTLCFCAYTNLQWLTLPPTSHQPTVAPGADSSWTYSGNCIPVLQSSHNLQGDELPRNQNSWQRHHHYSPAEFIIRLGECSFLPLFSVANIQEVILYSSQIVKLQTLTNCVTVQKSMIVCSGTLVVTKFNFSCYWQNWDISFYVLYTCLDRI
jgi:hypothetical protein